MTVTGSRRVAGGQGHACAAELLAHDEPRGVSCCNQLLLKTVWSLAMLRLPYNTPMVNIYI